MLEHDIKHALQAACANHVAPGFACAVLTPNADFQIFCGRHTYDPTSPKITADALWDVASLTKVVCTFQCYQILAQKGVINSDTLLGEILDCTGFADKGRLRIIDLLAHRAGFSGAIDYFREHTNGKALEDAIMHTDLPDPPNGRRMYDDASYTLLGRALQQHFNTTLEDVFRDLVLAPMGMHSACFNPTPQDRVRAVPTEWAPMLNAIAQGVVHDDNTRVLEGVAGHAGLFTTLSDLHHFNRAYLDAASSDRIFDLHDHLYTDMTGTYTIGWDVFNPRTMPVSTAEGWLSHTGFTGTMLSVSTRHKAAVVLLSNRVFPKRASNHKINVLRRRVLNLVMDHISTT